MSRHRHAIPNQTALSKGKFEQPRTLSKMLKNWTGCSITLAATESDACLQQPPISSWGAYDEEAGDNTSIPDWTSTRTTTREIGREVWNDDEKLQQTCWNTAIPSASRTACVGAGSRHKKMETGHCFLYKRWTLLIRCGSGQWFHSQLNQIGPQDESHIIHRSRWSISVIKWETWKW